MLTIGEFSKLCRVSTKTLRYYDQIGLFKPGYISSESGYRYYESAQLKDFLLIIKLKQYRFSLPEIAAVLAKGDSAFLSVLIRQKKGMLEKQLYDQERILRQMEEDIGKIERGENIMAMKYVIKTSEFAPKTLYTLRRKMGLKDFSAAFGDLCAGLEKNHIQPMGPFLSIYHDEEFQPEQTDIEVGVEAQGADGEVRTFAPGLCCHTTHVGPYDDFGPAYAALGAWIEAEKYIVAGPAFEVYVQGCESDAAPEAYVTEIYLPIKKI